MRRRPVCTGSQACRLRRSPSCCPNLCCNQDPSLSPMWSPPSEWLPTSSDPHPDNPCCLSHSPCVNLPPGDGRLPVTQRLRTLQRPVRIDNKTFRQRRSQSCCRDLSRNQD